MKNENQTINWRLLLNKLSDSDFTFHTSTYIDSTPIIYSIKQSPVRANSNEPTNFQIIISSKSNTIMSIST